MFLNPIHSWFLICVRSSISILHEFKFIFNLYIHGQWVSTVITDTEVRLCLAQEEEAALASGQMIMVQENMSPSVLIYQGLEIEDQQYVYTTISISYPSANWLI